MLSKTDLMIPLSVYEKMMDFAQSSPHREVIGPIFGKPNEDGSILLTASYSFRIGSTTEVHFIDSDYEKLLPLIKKHELQNEQWVGWFHSHPFQGGDFLYMSKTDIKYHTIAQKGNPLWTAIILNPHQKNDLEAVYGMRAFRLIEYPSKRKKSKYRVKELIFKIIDEK
ncbi:MAG: hypothetical protein K9W44_06930 [Candidatus Lokiarchaeota archaeon]|nr:hypothetical protein [Candidatus Harpocratesius repetitus]